MHLLRAQLNLPNKGTEPVWSRRGFRNRIPRRATLFELPCWSTPLLSNSWRVYEHNSCSGLALAFDRGTSHLALQCELGILPQRWFGDRSNCFNRVAGDRAPLTAVV